ncbi:uncharacterized protein LOC130808297 [Amaranthus tricolor]|uniref:uncharacterized protein LOC130808297 n=1 Tax=Amaranthus tricolor TaxID=29722 RepID=UPI00258EC5AC|nr:uncharacterized protein LOC130808297 [Amaranthus tricolor]
MEEVKEYGEVVNLNELNKWVVNGNYSVRCAYIDRFSNRPKPSWRALNKASPRSVICLWQILQNRLPTKDRLIKWGINCDASCVLFLQDVEVRNYLFHGCSFILSFKRCTMELMSKLCKRKYSRACVIVMVWTKLLYQIWFQRNVKIFGRKDLLPCQVANNVFFLLLLDLGMIGKLALLYSVAR